MHTQRRKRSPTGWHGVCSIPGMLKNLAHLALRIWLKLFHRYRVLGRLSLESPSLIIANHASHIDIAVITAAALEYADYSVRGAAARDTIFTQPGVVLCVLRFLFNVFPFERKNGSSESLERCTDYIQRGYHVIIFPEGRRSQDGSFLGFTPGFAKIAYATGAPVIPLRIEGAHRALPRGSFVLLPCPMELKVRPSLAADRTIPWDDRRQAYERLIHQANRSLAS